MRLLIADKLHPRAIDELRALPLEVEYAPDITAEKLEERLRGFGILVVRSTPVTAKAIESTRELNLIVRAGPTRRLRRELPGEERDRGRRARVRADDRARSAHRRRDQLAARRQVAA